jgi:hypothetical protein
MARPQPAHDPTHELTGGMPAEVTKHLRRHPAITLSATSCTGMPHAGTVAYASDSGSIFFFAGEGTLLRNIQGSRRVSFTIDLCTADWAKARELQGVGQCAPATADQHTTAWPPYLAKFGPGTALPPGLLHTIVPTELHFVDHHHAATTRAARPDRPHAPDPARRRSILPPTMRRDRLREARQARLIGSVNLSRQTHGRP